MTSMMNARSILHGVRVLAVTVPLAMLALAGPALGGENGRDIKISEPPPRSKSDVLVDQAKSAAKTATEKANAAVYQAERAAAAANIAKNLRASAETASEFEEVNRQEERARDALIEAEERARAAAKAAEDASAARVHALALNESFGIGVKGPATEEQLEATRVAADTAEKEAARAKAAVEAARVDVNALP